MPTGYSPDAAVKAKKVELDILTAKLKRIRDEFEKCEKEYAEACAKARHAGFTYEDKPVVEKIKPKFTLEEKKE